MKHISIMIKPASSLCNMRCKYCFYADIANLRENSFLGMMREDTTEKMLMNIEKSLEKGDHVTFAFQGGEPTLAGISFFEQFISKVQKWNKGIKVNYALQTNGKKIDAKWASFFNKHKFLLGISLDVLKDSHDGVRIDENGQGSWKEVCQSIDVLKQYKVEYNILCTLTNEVARYPKKVWNQLEKLDIKYIQFTPCLDDLDSSKKGMYALTPKRFAGFYTELFKLWYQSFQKGNYRSIKLFDDVVNLLALGLPTACGMTGQCQPHIIVEADGSTYPCDFYCLDEYMMGNIENVPLQELYQKSAGSACKKREKLPDLCSECKYFSICGGNCKRMQKEVCCTSEDNYCGYQEFLNKTMKEFLLISRQQRNR